jgi:predicted nucleotidyltransferase
MTSLDQIKLALGEHKSRLFKTYPIKSLGIFGSYARKEQSSVSDVDIIVEFDGSIGVRFIDLAEELESIVGKKVDLVSKKGIKEGYFNYVSKDIIYV